MSRFGVTLVLFFISMLILTGCAAPFAEAEQQILLDNETVKIEAQGLLLVVTDKLNGNTYAFRPVRVKRTETNVEPVTMISTPTIRIEAVWRGLRITTGNKVYVIHRKLGGVWNAKKD